nr:MAG: polyprotein [Picornavirales sp.]
MGKPNLLSEYVTKHGLETGLNFPNPVLKPRNRKSKKQKEKSRAHQFTLKESAFPTITEEEPSLKEEIIEPTPVRKLKKRKTKFNRVSVTPQDLVQRDDSRYYLPLTKENLDKYSDLKTALEENKYYKDNGHLDTEIPVYSEKKEMELFSQHIDFMDMDAHYIPRTVKRKTHSTLSAAGAAIMKLLPDSVTRQLEEFGADPIEIITCFVGVAGYLTTLASMTKQTNNKGIKVGMTLMTIDYLHRIYNICSKSKKALATFDQLSSDLTQRMNDIDNMDEMNFEFNFKIAKTISAVGGFLLSCFGISPAKQMTDFLAYRKASEESFDILTVLLWECLDIDIKGDKLLLKEVKKLTDEGTKFEQMLSQDLFGKNMMEAETWVEKAIKLDRALGKSPDMRLRSLIAKVTNTISETRKADAGSSPIPTPACVILYGKPGLGKSLFSKFIFQQLSNHFNTDDRIFDLNTGGKHFGHYANEQWGFYDEFGAEKEIGENNFMKIINQILSGNPANIPGAAIEDKHQYSKFTGINLISNKTPRSLELGLVPEAKDAFISRLIQTEVIDPNHDPKLHRDAQTHQAENFSNLVCKVRMPNGKFKEFPGDKFYLYVAEVVQNNQNKFAKRKNMFGSAATVTTSGRLVRDAQNLADFTQRRTLDLLDPDVNEDGAIPKGELPNMEFTPSTSSIDIDTDVIPQLFPDSMDASIGRTLWISGPPGNGKTLGIVPFIKRYADNTDTPIVEVTRQYGTRARKMHWIKPATPIGVIYILDDVVDPTTKEGQIEYADFYDRHIAATNSTAVVISNYGPQKGYFSRITGALASLLSSSAQYTPAVVEHPAFGRRSGWTCDGGSMHITTDDRLSFSTPEGKTVVIDEFITSYLSGVIGDAPITINEVLPSVMPFTQAESDLWLDLQPEITSVEILRAIIQGSSSRVARLANKLHSLNLDQFDVKVGINVYKTLLKQIPDVKIRVVVGPVVLIGHGKELYMSKASTSAYTFRFDHNGIPCIPTIFGDIGVKREDYIAFLTKELLPADKYQVAAFNAFSHAQSLDKEAWGKLEAAFPLSFSEVLSISNKRMMAGIAKQKNIILGTLGVGALVTTFAMVLKYAFSSDSDQVTIPEDQMEAGRAGSKIKILTRGKPGNKKPVCSDTDKFDDDADRHEYDYAYDELSSPEAKIDFKGGDIYITKNYSYKGKNKVVRYNTNTKHMDYGTELDVANAAYLPLQTRDPQEEAFVGKLIKNTVIVRAGNVSENYATMLNSQIGQVPLHTVKGHEICTASWFIDGDFTAYKTVRIQKIYECPEREVCFFALVDEQGYLLQGPFKDLYKNLLSMADISQVTRANMLVPNTRGGHDVLMGQFKLECTIEPKLNTEIIQHWTTDIGYIHYGVLDLPLLRGKCGVAYYAKHGGKCYFLGTHAVSRPGYSKIGATICSVELWRELAARMESVKPKEKPIEVEENVPLDELNAKAIDYIRMEEFDKISKDDHEVFETLVPKQIMALKTDKTDDMIQPHGPGTILVSGFDNKRPYDTKASYKHLGIEGMDKLFKTEKVPTLTEEEILEQFPERITPDAKGNLHVPYTRLSANNKNTGAPGISAEIKQLAEDLADFMIEEMGKETVKLRPLSVQEAISGTHTAPPFKRESAAGGVLGTIFGYSKKVDFVDYNEATRTITWKGIHGKFIERWTEDQYDFAKKMIRLHIPATVGLKSEKLLFKKLHKKRIFMITSVPTWINQKRVFLPVQNIFTHYDNTEFTRLPLVFDPHVDSNDLCNWFYEGTQVGASFDWDSFDLTADVNLMHGVGYFTKRCYDRLGDEGNKVGNVCITLMQDMAAGTFVMGKAWLRTLGGVESGSGCTSYIDSIIVLQAVFSVIFDMIKEQGLKMTRREIFRKVKTLGGGDDLMVAVEKAFAKYIDLSEMFKRVKAKFNMILTLDTKEEGEMKWRPFDECSFLSRHFIRHPDFPVWISKLKEESVGSILNWSNATNPHQQARQIEAAAMEVFPYGEEIYNTYRTSCMHHFKKLNIPVDIPSYTQTSEWLGTAIMTKEHPAEFQERFLLESSTASVKKQLRSIDLTNVVKTKPQSAITMPSSTLRSAFIKTVKETTDIAQLMTTPEFHEMANYGAYIPLPAATVALKDKSRVMSVPRNTPSLWAYLKFLSNYDIDMDKKTAASYQSFCEQWSKVDEKNWMHTRTTMWLKNIYFLLAKDHRFNINEFKKWVTDEYQDTLDTKPKGEQHHHVCVKCGELYFHTHPMRHAKHEQFPNQCTNRDCIWFQGTNTHILNVISHQVATDKFAEQRWAKQVICDEDHLDIEFGIIGLFNGTLTNTAELLCRAGLAKPIVQWKNTKQLSSSSKEYIRKLVQKHGRNQIVETMFPGLFREEVTHKVKGDRAYTVVKDVMDSAPAGTILPLNPPSSGGANPGPPTAASGSTTSVPTGHAAVDLTANIQEGNQAEVVQPAAVSTGAAANDTILSTFGGLPTDMLQVGGYVNSLLAFVYNPVPLATIPVSADTLEYATLYEWKINPWDLDGVGPYIYKWAKNHDRFAGGFKIGVQVSTSAVIIGKLGIYWIPSGVSVPAKKTRTNMEYLPHTVIDLFSPSSNQLEVRPTTEDKWFITRKTKDQDWGKVIIMAFTAVTNVIGGDSATAPPVYPTICLMEDSVYTVPVMDEDPDDHAYDIPPTPPADTFFVTEGHNKDPTYFPNENRKPEVTNDGYLRPQWMTTSGRVRTEPSDVSGENQMSFYWGSRFTTVAPGYAQAQQVIGVENQNHNRYQLNFDDELKFSGLSSIADEAVIGRSYNVQNSQQLAGTDQYAQLFKDEVQVDTINYIANDFRVWADNKSAPWWGAFENQGAQTPTQVKIVQFGDSPVELKVRQLSKTSSKSRFYEIRASNLGVQSGANVVSPTDDYLKNPAGFMQGPENPDTLQRVDRKVPEISITSAVVCNQSLKTTGATIPPGYRLVTFWDQNDPDNWFGLPAVLPGVRGITTPMGKKGADFKTEVQNYLERTNTKSYVLRIASYDSSMAFDMIVNTYGAFIFSPEHEYTVIPTSTQYFFTRYLSSDRNQDWVPIARPSEGLFQSRLSITRSHPGFVLGKDLAPIASQQDLPKDTMDSSVIGSILGGAAMGVGQGLSSWADMSFQKEMQRNQFTQQSKMQKNYLGAQTAMNTRTNEAREYAAKHAADAQEWSANRNAQANVEAARARIVGGNRVSTIM